MAATIIWEMGEMEFRGAGWSWAMGRLASLVEVGFWGSFLSSVQDGRRSRGTVVRDVMLEEESSSLSERRSTVSISVDGFSPIRWSMGFLDSTYAALIWSLSSTTGPPD